MRGVGQRGGNSPASLRRHRLRSVRRVDRASRYGARVCVRSHVRWAARLACATGPRVAHGQGSCSLVVPLSKRTRSSLAVLLVQVDAREAAVATRAPIGARTACTHGSGCRPGRKARAGGGGGGGAVSVRLHAPLAAAQAAAGAAAEHTGGGPAGRHSAGGKQSPPSAHPPMPASGARMGRLSPRPDDIAPQDDLAPLGRRHRLLEREAVEDRHAGARVAARATAGSRRGCRAHVVRRSSTVAAGKRKQDATGHGTARSAAARTR